MFVKTFTESSGEKLATLVQDNLVLENKILTESVKGKLSSSDSSKIVRDPHWSVFKQEATPDYILEAKKRLGQIKQPNISPKDIYIEKDSKKPTSPTPSIASNSSSLIDTRNESNNQQKHWSNIESRATPDYIRAIRQRLGDDRYRRMSFRNTSNSSVNLKSDSPSISDKYAQKSSDSYKIPNYLTSTKNGVTHLKMNTEKSENSLKNILPVSENLIREIDNVIEIAQVYEDQKKKEDERNSRLSNDSKMSNNSRVSVEYQGYPNTGMSYETWARAANEKGL